jgi:hypothetical protein
MKGIVAAAVIVFAIAIGITIVRYGGISREGSLYSIGVPLGGNTKKHPPV